MIEVILPRGGKLTSGNRVSELEPSDWRDLAGDRGIEKRVSKPYQICRVVERMNGRCLSLVSARGPTVEVLHLGQLRRLDLNNGGQKDEIKLTLSNVGPAPRSSQARTRKLKI